LKIYVVGPDATCACTDAGGWMDLRQESRILFATLNWASLLTIALGDGKGEERFFHVPHWAKRGL